MKNRYILVLFILAAIIVVVGALFKIMHWPGAAIMLIAGLLAEALCGLLLILKLIKGNKNSDGFLDS
jgi:hypothetical protein